MCCRPHRFNLSPKIYTKSTNALPILLWRHAFIYNFVILIEKMYSEKILIEKIYSENIVYEYMCRGYFSTPEGDRWLSPVIKASNCMQLFRLFYMSETVSHFPHSLWFDDLCSTWLHFERVIESKITVFPLHFSPSKASSYKNKGILVHASVE